MTVPVVFAFDNNMLLPATVCISSLLRSAKSDTFYDIFILYSGSKPRIECEDKFKEAYSNLRITYRSVGDTFKNAYEIRGITAATYYRLLASELIPEYNKIIYSDVDIIFRMDLSELFSVPLQNNYLAATYALEKSLSKDGRSYSEKIGITPGEYFQAGVLLMNLHQMRLDNLTKRMIGMVPANYEFQDQDILNIVCKGKIIALPWNYNMGTTSFIYPEKRPELMTDKYANHEFNMLYTPMIVHFNGEKPWKNYCLNFDLWWECYRKSPVFDPKFYFNFYYEKLNYLDHLPLLKRIKILIRYFIYGTKKDI